MLVIFFDFSKRIRAILDIGDLGKPKPQDLLKNRVVKILLALDLIMDGRCRHVQAARDFRDRRSMCALVRKGHDGRCLDALLGRFPDARLGGSCFCSTSHRTPAANPVLTIERERSSRCDRYSSAYILSHEYDERSSSERRPSKRASSLHKSWPGTRKRARNQDGGPSFKHRSQSTRSSSHQFTSHCGLSPSRSDTARNEFREISTAWCLEPGSRREAVTCTFALDHDPIKLNCIMISFSLFEPLCLT